MKRLVRAIVLCLPILLAFAASAQFAPQQVLREGLLTQNHRGSFIASAFAADGSLYLLFDSGDGIHVLKTDKTASTLEAQLHLGAAGDSPTALAVDPSGNVYIAGTSTSGSLAGSAGVPFPAAADNSANAFVAKLDPQLNLTFLTFVGAGHTAATSIAATSTGVLVTGTIFSSSLPVTANAIEQSPASGSKTNGFVESFSASGTQLNYATYLSGLNGDTEPVAIAADATGHAFIAGETSAAGYPTINALQPAILGGTSGFLTELTPAGDELVFSTFIAGSSITGLALNVPSNTLLITGIIALGQFPVATANTPLASTTYQSLLELTPDGQSITNGVVLGPGSQSLVASAPDGSAWVTLMLSTPLLPSTIAASYEPGDSVLLHVLASGASGQSLRVGGSPVGNASYASLATSLVPPAVSTDGSRIAAAGTVAINLSSELLGTQSFDLATVGSPDALLPNSVQDIVPDAATCGTSSQCAGSGGLLAILDRTTAAPSFAVSIDDPSNITLSNLGSAAASSLNIQATGYSATSDCGSSLSPAAQCSVALVGSGPGSLTLSASGIAPITVTLPASTSTADPLALSSSELDFGIVSAASAASRTLTVTNLSNSQQTFAASRDAGASATSYTLTLGASTCAESAQNQFTMTAGSSCALTFLLAASASGANDGPVRSVWKVGDRDVTITGFAQAAALNVSASEIDFGQQSPLAGAKHLPRYLFLSNNSQSAVSHTAASLPTTSPFSVADACPSTLQPQTVCRLEITYSSSTAPSNDSATLNVDNGLSVLLTGQTLSQQSVSGSTTDPNVAVSPLSLTFANPVTVTELSTSTQGVQVTNGGPTSVAVSASISGDFTLESQCPASLASGSSCELLLSFAPSQPGLREGILSISAGGTFSPTTVILSGNATAILPPNNGTLALGATNIGEPIIQWYPIQAALPSLNLSSSNTAFTLAVAANSQQPPSLPSTAFSSTASASCDNCWLGIQFLSQTAGAQSGTLTLSTVSGGIPEQLTLTASATSLTGLQLTPPASDFGSIPVHSSTAPLTLTLTNLVSPAAIATIQSITATGDFSLLPPSSGDCTSALDATAACTIEVVFAPTELGSRSGTLTVVTDTGSVTTSLSGYGTADPGIALQPDALIFNNQSGAVAMQQMITVVNTSTSTVAIATPTSSSASFSATSTCGGLAASAQCSITVTFTPGETFAQGTLTIPVSTGSGAQLSTMNYTVSLSATYAANSAGLLITPSQSNLGSAATNTLGSSREFTVTNLTAQPLALSMSLPRQFPPTGTSNCNTLAAGGTCTLSVSLEPATNGPLTGTLQVTGTPSTGASIQSLAYLLGFGQGSGSLTITAASSPLNFGNVASGQSNSQSIALTNSGTGELNIRRIVSQPPFFATTSCGASLSPAAACTVTIAYAPVYDLAPGSSGSPTRLDTSILSIESDATSSPDTVSLEGTASAIISAQSTASTIGTYALSSSALTYSVTQIANASPAQTLTLTNTGTTTLHIRSIVAPSDFTATSSCSTLLPSATCSVSVQFTPGDQSAQQLRTGTLDISSDATDALEFVTLLGSSTPAPLTLTPTTLDFGSVNIAQSSQLPVTVTNTSGSPIKLGNLVTSAPFSAGSGTCPASGSQLVPGAQCTLNVTFTPSAAGQQASVLSVASSATQLPLTVALTGTGAGNSTPPPSSFTLTVNGSSSASVVIASGQPAAFTLTAASVNSYGGPIALTCDPLGSAPYATCSLLASTLTLANNSQSSTATINTITSSPQSSRRFAAILLLPLALLAFSRRLRRNIRNSALLVAFAAAALSVNGCGGGSSPAQAAPANLLYTPPGTYQWRVTASSTSGPAITSSVTLSVTIQ